MHKLYARQLAKATDASGSVDLAELGRLVSAAYDDQDRERRRTDRSIQLMVEEVDRVHRQLLDAIDVIPEGLALFDADDRYVLWNAKYTEFYPAARDLIKVGARFEDVLRAGLEREQTKDPESREAWLKERLARHRRPVNSEEQCLPDGRWLRVEERRTGDGGSIGIRIDITELKKREESFRLLFDSNPVPMWVIDLESGKFIAVNDAALASYGYSREQFLMMTARDLRPEEDREEFDRLMRSGRLSQGSLVWRHRTADGSIRQVTVYGRDLAYAGRRARICAVVDVTERKRAENIILEQKRRLDTALQNMSQGLLMFDADERLVICNDRYIEMYGLSREVVKPGCSLRDLIEHRRASGSFAGDIDEYYDALMQDLRQNRTSTRTIELPDGRFIHVVQRPMTGGGWVATHEDITERKRAEKERDRSQAFLDLVIENIPVTVVVKDARDFRYLLVNRAGENYYGLPRSRMLGKTAQEILAPEAAKMLAELDRKVWELGGKPLVDEHFIEMPDKRKRASTSIRMPMFDERGNPQYLLVVVNDITERRDAEARIAHLAMHDPLTDLPNRVAYNERFDVVLANARTTGEPFAVVCIDLDRFKEVNDVFGHGVGDQLLCALAKRFQAEAAGGFVARLGGDEFAIISIGGPQPATAEAMAHRLLDIVANEIEVGEHRLRAGLSIGVAVFPTDGADAATLQGNADAALYRAKAEGRGVVRFFAPEMDSILRERRALQHDLRLALERDELRLHFQPLAKIDGEIIGFEALARWYHPQRGIVSPATFIPIAEESGLIVKLGEAILRTACREAASWSSPLQVAINLSPLQFRHGDLPNLVHTVLLETGLAPGRLELEITENTLIDDFSRAASILRRLKSLGVRISMDDFGTGYSSLSYLQSFPFDKIKIDQAFIANLRGNAQSAAIIRAVIGLARGLGLPVAAEGVETPEQLAFLRRELCDQVQGYLLGKPAPIADYSDVIRGLADPARKKLALAS